MLKTIINYYKIPFLLAVTLSLSLIAISIITDPITIGLIITGCIIGMFFLDLDFFIHAYFIDKDHHFSKTLITFIKHKDLANAFNYINYHKDEIEDLTLNSALFQVCLGMLAIFVVSSTTYVILKAIVISAFANSIYRVLELYHEGKSDIWFWVLKTKPENTGFYTYIAAMVAILSYTCFYF